MNTFFMTNIIKCYFDPVNLVRTLTLGLVLLVVPFLPACNIFFRVGFVIAERVLYLSSAGYCLLLAYALGHCCGRWSRHKVENIHTHTHPRPAKSYTSHTFEVLPIFL